MLKEFWTVLQGKKTYMVAAATLIYAVLGVLLHDMTIDQAMPYIFAALGAVGFRSAMKK